MIFWRLGPGWYFQLPSSEQVPRHEQDVYDLLTEIQARVVAGGFPRGEIAIDPRHLDGRDLTQEYRKEGGIERVAAEMFVPSPGRIVPLEELA